jgi:hypothetical protein
MPGHSVQQQSSAPTTPQTPIQVTPFYQQQPQQQPQQPTPQQVLQNQSIPVTVTTTAANQPQINFEDQSPSDPYLSSILDDFISMQQEMNLDLPARHARQAQVQANEDTMLLKLLEEVIEPAAPNVATPSTPVTPVDLNERMAISAIQKQLMSFEVTTPTSPNVVTSPFASVTSAPPNYQQIPPPAYTATTYGQQIANSAQQVMQLKITFFI